MAGQRPTGKAAVVLARDGGRCLCKVVAPTGEMDGAGTGEVGGSGTGCILEKSKSGFLVLRWGVLCGCYWSHLW